MLASAKLASMSLLLRSRSVRAEADVYFKDTGYVASARRYDMGERDHFISMEMAAIGMEMLATWGQSAIVDRLAMLTERLAAGLAECGAIVPAARVRAPHILSITPRTGSPATIVERLGHDNVHVALRLGRKLTWDPRAEQITGDEEAAKWLSRPYRAPWKLA